MKSIILKIVTTFILLLSLNSYAERPPYSGNLDALDSNCSFLPAEVECLKGGWYLDYIGMNYIYDNNYDLTPDFTVGIMDTGIGYHSDIDLCEVGQTDCLVTDISDYGSNTPIAKIGEITGHGNAITSIFSGSRNELNGMRSIVQAKTLFISHSSIGDQFDDLMNNNISEPKIVNFSFHIRLNNMLIGQYLNTLHEYRKLLLQYPNTLFVVAAGNDNIDAKYSSGALHYAYIGDYDSATETEKNDESNYELSKLPNVIIVAANNHKGVLFEYSNYGESVDITAPSGIFAAGCSDDFKSTYYKSKSWLSQGDYYGYYNKSYGLTDLLWDFFVTTVDANDDFNKPCEDNLGIANGTSTSTPIVAGAAAILLNRNTTLTPAQLKGYLTQTPSLIKTGLRYSTDINSSNGYGNLCQGVPYLDYCNVRTPLLNIEKSMKQYETEHKVVEDFTGMLNRLKTSNYPVKINRSKLPYGIYFNNFSYLGVNASNYSSLTTPSIKYELKKNDLLFNLTQSGRSNMDTSTYNYNLSFKYYSDIDVIIKIVDSNTGSIVGSFTLQKGSINQKSITFSAKNNFRLNFINDTVESGNLVITNMSLLGISLDLSQMKVTGMKEFINTDNISYSTTGNNFYSFFPSEKIYSSFINTGDDFNIKLPYIIKKLKFTYNSVETRTGIIPYFQISDGNNKLLYTNNNLAPFGTEREATVNIPQGTNSIRFTGNISNIYFDKFEYTH
jgi:hypothetical protein